MVVVVADDDEEEEEGAVDRGSVDHTRDALFDLLSDLDDDRA